MLNLAGGWFPLTFVPGMMVRRGYGDDAARIQELFLSGRKEEAIAAVPDEYLDKGALVGPIERIRERYKAWEGSGITGLTLSCNEPEGLKLMADLAGCRDNIAAAQ